MEILVHSILKFEDSSTTLYWSTSRGKKRNPRKRKKRKSLQKGMKNNPKYEKKDIKEEDLF
jgi:hypothetical protein